MLFINEAFHLLCFTCCALNPILSTFPFIFIKLISNEFSFANYILIYLSNLTVGPNATAGKSSSFFYADTVNEFENLLA